MTKADVKLLCENNENLAWWAMIFFAEIVDYVAAVHLEGTGSTDTNNKLIAQYVQRKVDEFPLQVIHDQLEQAKKRAAE